MIARNRRLVFLGGAVAIVLAGTVAWQVGWEAHYLRRLKEKPELVRSLIGVSETSPAGRAMRRFLRRPSGMKALLDTLSPPASDGSGAELVVDPRERDARRRHVERWLRLVVGPGSSEARSRPTEE